MEEKVVLVDKNDSEVGVEEKMEAHRQGKLHRCFSIFIFNEQGKLLLQRRNKQKYHSGGLWANTCCSHPRPGEDLLAAAHRRLKEEMGFDCELKELFSFIYKAKFDNGLTEHEYDHVIIGTYAGRPSPNPEEVEDWKWVTLDELNKEIRDNPDKYVYWLKVSFDELLMRVKHAQSGEGYDKAPAADFFSYKYKEDVEKALKELLPEELTAQWAEQAIGKARWGYDANSLTKALSQPVWNFLSRGGKRWRPMLMLICCEAVGGNPPEIMPFTVIPELIHNGSLIVDDIEDNSDLRRGKPVLHKIFGVDIAVNAGNTLYLLPFISIRDASLPAATKAKAYEIISTQLLKCHFGQATDIYWHTGKSDVIPTEAQYLQMCANKSGSLASMAAQLGALLGGGSEEQIQALAHFAETGGVVFQIQDDSLNIAEHNSIGKEFGDDIKEGKRTLLVIHTLNVATPAEKNRLLGILNMHTGDEALLKEAAAIIEKYNSITYARKTATQLAENAWKEVEAVLPESEAKSQLKDLAQLLTHRSV